MNNNNRRLTKLTALSVSVLICAGGSTLSAQSAHAAPGPSLSAAAPAPVAASVQTRGPIVVKVFWSSIMRVFITFSNHALRQMGERRISAATVQQILNYGKVISRHNGITSVRSGQITVRVNTRTGNVITVIWSSGGGGR